MKGGRSVTLCLSYYENASMLLRHYRLLAAIPKPLQERLQLIVVDDGSPDNPAPPPPAGFPLPCRGFRMQEDVPWNQDACRNLAAQRAMTEWLLLTDMDHLVPDRTLDRCCMGALDPLIAYNFCRVSEPRLDPYKPHPNSWLMTRHLYFRARGYDERFRGVYGTDGMFRKRVAAIAVIQSLPEVLIRVPREVTPDASTTRYARKTPEAAIAKDRVTEEITASGDPIPKWGLTPWAPSWDNRA